MKRRGSVTFGILLILAGAWFLAVELIPSFNEWYTQFADWPFWVIGPGLIFIFAAIISGVSALAIPGAILSGIGGILYYQQVNNDWQSWAYAWTLIVGFVGIGIFIMLLLDGEYKKAFREGGGAVLTSLVMFLLFGSVMRKVFGQEPFFGEYWPVLIIIWGVWMLIKPLLRDSTKKERIATVFGVNVDLGNDEDEEVVVEVDEIVEVADSGTSVVEETEAAEEAEE